MLPRSGRFCCSLTFKGRGGAIDAWSQGSTGYSRVNNGTLTIFPPLQVSHFVLAVNVMSICANKID